MPINPVIAGYAEELRAIRRDAIAASGQFLTALQTIVARTVDPLDAAVVSACSIFGGDPEAWSVIPDEVTLRGTARAYRPAVRDHLEAAIGRIAAGMSAALGVTADYRFIRRNPPVVNDPVVTETAARAAASVVGDRRVVHDFPPSTAGDVSLSCPRRCPAPMSGSAMDPPRMEGCTTTAAMNSTTMPWSPAPASGRRWWSRNWWWMSKQRIFGFPTDQRRPASGHEGRCDPRHGLPIR